AQDTSRDTQALIQIDDTIADRRLAREGCGNRVDYGLRIELAPPRQLHPLHLVTPVVGAKGFGRKREAARCLPARRHQAPLGQRIPECPGESADARWPRTRPCHVDERQGHATASRTCTSAAL